MKTRRHAGSYRKLFQEITDSVQLSCEAYDKGFLGEAKRLALCVRVLVHDTAQSRSLFEQVGIKRKLTFAGSPSPYNKGNLLSECHLVMMHVTAAPSYLPVLDQFPIGPWQSLPFDGWWNEVVIKDTKAERFSRKDLVLWFANKEGGAHIDPQLDERYRRLQEENSFGWVFKTGAEEITPVASVELACMRQIAHELLKTIQKNGKVIARSLS